MREAGLRFRYAIGLTALLLFVSEWFQVYIHSATPEITDPLLALGLGAAMALYLRAAGESAPPADSQSTPVRAGRKTRAMAGGVRTAGASSGVRRGQSRWTALLLTLLLSGVLALAVMQPDPAPASFRGQLDWAAARAGLIADLHTHTRTSDGSLSEAELVAEAVGAGCNVLAITDHTDVKASGGASQRQAIAALRREYPKLLLFLGLELNIPSHGQREHMNLLLHPDQEAEWLPRFQRAVEKAMDSRTDPDRGFLNLANRLRDGGHPALLIYNHPSRKVDTVDESLADLQRWRALGTRVRAMAGAPGHQHYEAIGSYQGAISTVNRWDPAAAVVGGVWDRYLASGDDLWAALASSDYHGGRRDATPCAFSRIHISAPSRSHAGVLEALDRGTFWSDHGRILDHLSLAVELEGLPRPLYPGESADVFTENGAALARVELERGPGSVGKALGIEVISSCIDGSSRVIGRQLLGAEENSTEALILVQATPEKSNSCTVRARVRLDNLGLEPDLLAYTNTVRINLRLGVLEGRILDWRLN